MINLMGLPREKASLSLYSYLHPVIPRSSSHFQGFSVLEAAEERAGEGVTQTYILINNEEYLKTLKGLKADARTKTTANRGCLVRVKVCYSPGLLPPRTPH